MQNLPEGGGGGRKPGIMGDMQTVNLADTFLRPMWLTDLRPKYSTSSLSLSF